MKQLLLLSIVLLSFACTQEKQDGYTITGKVSGIENGWVKLIKQDYTSRNGNYNVIDSVKTTDGSFNFKGKVEHVDEYVLLFNEEQRASFILENCEMTLEAVVSLNESGRSQTEMTVQGSLLNDKLKELNNKALSVLDKKKYAIVNQMQAELRAAYKSKDEKAIEIAKERFAPYATLRQEQYKEYQNFKIDYAKANPSSVVALYALGFTFSEGRMTPEQMKEIYPLFSGAAIHTSIYKYYTKTYKEIFSSLGEGATVPDFTLPTLKGETITLSEVKGKYILIDFWASWCAPCRASLKHVKKLYSKYHKDGFEVIAIGTADVGSKWRKAIEEDGTIWINAFDGDINKEGNGKGAYGEISQLYGVPFLPTTFLVDENGKILSRQIRGEELDKKLVELFKY